MYEPARNSQKSGFEDLCVLLLGLRLKSDLLHAHASALPQYSCFQKVIPLFKTGQVQLMSLRTRSEAGVVERRVPLDGDDDDHHHHWYLPS